MSLLKIETPYSIRFIRVWITLGVVGLLLVVSMPFLIDHATQQEYDRFIGCQKKERVDCQTSIIWLNQGWSLADQAVPSTEETAASQSQETTRLVKNDPAGPDFVSVQPDGMKLQNHRYIGEPGAKVTLKVQATGAASIDMSIIQQGPDGSPIPSFVGSMAQDKTTGMWTKAFTVDPNLFGDIALTAKTKDGKSSTMYVKVAANQTSAVAQ